MGMEKQDSRPSPIVADKHGTNRLKPRFVG